MDFIKPILIYMCCDCVCAVSEKPFVNSKDIYNRKLKYSCKKCLQSQWKIVSSIFLWTTCNNNNNNNNNNNGLLSNALTHLFIYSLIQSFLSVHQTKCIVVYSLSLLLLFFLQALLGGTLRIPGIHGEIDLKVQYDRDTGAVSQHLRSHPAQNHTLIVSWLALRYFPFFSYH